MKGLPIGITTLRKIREKDMVYVDKTGIIEHMAAWGGYYFLSRPRRFGKSLLVDTFRELFEGNEELFQGLAIHDRWDWSKKYPVVKIDFAGGMLRSETDFSNKIEPVFDRIAERHDLSLTSLGLPNRLNELIRSLYYAAGTPVVVLVDEYDKPMLDNIEEPETAALMRDLLKDFYSTLKEVDEYLHFVFLTGVSKFSKVSIFSGINNLKDITLDSTYATICGYTQEDLETAFAEHLAGVDWEDLRRWYNGYCFVGEAVYNPFDILLFISEKLTYRNFWFETGTPTFLVKLMQRNRYFLPNLENMEAGEELLSSFEVESIEPATLLFQAGYLSIKERDFRRGRMFYRLGFPNQEVRLAFNDYLVTAYTMIGVEKVRHADLAYNSLRNADMQGLQTAVQSLFAGIPWRNFTNNDIADYEGYYASVLYAFFVSITCTVIPEDINNHGQADLTVILDNTICVMEIKVVKDDEEAQTCADAENGNIALDQIQTCNYAEKYLAQPKMRVFEVGMIFDRTKRNLESFAWKARKERLQQRCW